MTSLTIKTKTWDLKLKFVINEVLFKTLTTSVAIHIKYRGVNVEIIVLNLKKEKSKLVQRKRNALQIYLHTDNTFTLLIDVFIVITL